VCVCARAHFSLFFLYGKKKRIYYLKLGVCVCVCISVPFFFFLKKKKDLLAYIGICYIRFYWIFFF
jgi:hypothetical protein